MDYIQRKKEKRAATKTECAICGGTYVFDSKTKHNSSKKHRDAVKQKEDTERIENIKKLFAESLNNAKNNLGAVDYANISNILLLVKV